MKEDLDKLIVTERTESIVPIIFVLFFWMAFHGPNAKHFGNIKLSLWHYEAIYNTSEYIWNICLLGAVDSLSFVVNGMLLWTTCKINVMEILKNLQAKYWLFFGIQISHCLIQVRRKNFMFIFLIFKRHLFLEFLPKHAQCRDWSYSSIWLDQW